ncbi:MAG: type II toxin-antitoxin system VapC family toxin [Microbacteriaceae bacterium]
MFYLDTSALTKLVLPESESPQLKSYLGSANSLVSSELVRVELPRALLRKNHRAVRRAAQMLESTTLVALHTDLLRRAGMLLPPALRSLDAIHLASALTIRDDLEAFVAYDARLLEAATAFGLPVASPGAP